MTKNNSILPFIAALGIIVLIVLIVALFGGNKIYNSAFEEKESMMGKAVSGMVKKCVDSDKGIDPYAPGKVKYWLENRYVYYVDNCDYGNPGYLDEYYCEEGKVKIGEVKCNPCIDAYPGYCK